ncbi:hypothetical protein GCM10009616_09200 [Microlunatus lacustris]
MYPVHQLPPEIPGLSEWQPLARGGFSAVWRARQETLDRLVAVKVDERTLDSDAERRRFLGEARAAGNLSGHPGIVTVHDAGILADGRPYLVMKLCSGGSLTRWLDPENRKSPEQIRGVGVRIADALAATHAQGVLHRDVKPANILIDNYGNAGLADFGLAAVTEPGSAAAITPAYAAPESLRGERPTESGDVYQLGATLYALLSGHPPREPLGTRVSLADLVERLDEPVEPLPGVNQDLMQVLLDSMSPDPADRPSATELRDRLAAVDLTGSTHAAALTLSPPPRRRRLAVTMLVTAFGAVLAIALAASGVYLYEIDRSVTANITRGLELPPETSTAGVARPQKEPDAAKALDYLLIGEDGGDRAADRGGPSDSVMLLHLNAARDRAYVISVPRDTEVTLPGHEERTINYAYSLGGAPLVVQAVEQLTGVRVDHVATINFQGFANLTRDLDGVPVRNSRAFVAGGYTFPQGTITLQGDAALAFVRDNRAGELVRAENQRNLLKAILAKGLSADVVTDPLRFTTFIGNAAKHVKLDNSLSDSELRSTAVSLRLTPGDIRLLSVPLEDGRPTRAKPYRPVREGQFKQFASALRTDTMDAYVEKHGEG